ncbi:golvesin C-terminal-like domain-containing protein [Streptomyces melanogenes]|uniref:golvesin C-terminal-like domain-containing protein n=1 Tax=Streptomyces melanogenes TaxID=67326 RepID=UPI001E4554DE|nr:Tat pathway signal protein [Streptomyces melanogenes]
MTAVAAAALLTGLLPGMSISAWADAPTPKSPATPSAPGQVQDPGKKLGKDWQSSPDRAVTAAADRDGLQILVADSSKAYTWKTVATLSEPGMPADSWIGNQCQMDRGHAAVVYAPRSFTNKPDLMQGGAFTAIVDLESGRVAKLPFTASLAYFDPACNTITHTAAFTAFRDMNDPASTKTRVITVDTSGKTLGSAAAKGELTSAVPVKNGTVAALGKHLVHLDQSGKVKSLADADSTPFDIRPAADGKVAFVDRKNTSTAHAKLFTGKGKPSSIATGKLGDLDLMQGDAGKVFLTGHPATTPAARGTGVIPINAPAATDISSHGRLAVDPVLTPGLRAGLKHVKDAGKGFTQVKPAPERSAAPTAPAASADEPVTITSTATTTGAKLAQSVQQENTDGSAIGLSPALKAAAPARPKMLRGVAAASNDPTDPDRWCSVSRNDVNVQALQPTPNQVEWAVDMAVRGNLRAGYLRQGGYRDQAGLGTIDPQGLFPPPTLNGGGKIPANVLLGIMAQESNLWQAESGSIPGQMGNPLAAVDGYYGHKAVAGNPDASWQIHWDKSDCGYGVGQVTDGMRLAGHEKTGETSLSPALQKLIAVDYATNVAASMKILASKWNEVHTDGQKITVNNDDPSMVENWFTAVWNYNLGFNPPSEASAHGGHWGLGWYNNPANPLYKKSWGHPFMDTTVDGTEANRDAAHPQDWPYEEKVMGWAAWSIDTGFSYGTDGRQDWKGESGFSSAGFRPAWWDLNLSRSLVSPPLGVFCNSANNCDPDTPPNCKDEACYAQFWWNKPNATWKQACASQCGHESIKYQTLISEPGRGTRLKNGTPVCTGAPAGALVVASVPDGTPTWGDCGKASSAGSFEFTFTPGAEGRYEAKADLHQIGGGYGGHFWYAHDRNVAHLGGNGGVMSIDGAWKLGKAVDKGQAKVYAHIPDTGAQTKEAIYQIVTPFGTVNRTVDQGANAGKWVDLGAYRFNGQQPEVKLSNANSSGTADKDIAWGAVAFVPGNYSGLPEIHVPAENPNAPDIDFVATQKAKETAPAGAASQKLAAGPAHASSCRVGGDGVTLCAEYKPLSAKTQKTASPLPTAAAPSKPRAAAAGGTGPVGWCKNVNGSAMLTRTEGCLRGMLPLTATRDGAPIGNAVMQIIQEINLNPKSNQFTTWTEISLINMTGISSTSLTSFDENCWPTTGCAETEGPWTGSTTWTAGDTHVATRTNTYTWNKIAGGDQILNLDWTTAWSTPQSAVKAVPKWSNSGFDMRCDNKVAGNTGCVFYKYTPTLQLNTKKYPAAAAYYWVIMEKLASHPGSEKYNKPLHRLADESKAKGNRDVMCDLAVAEWKPHPDATGPSCDEYPFAKSRESGGQSLTSGKYCVQMYDDKNTGLLELDSNYPYPTWNEVCGRGAVPAIQNTSAGGELGRFTSDIRLLDNDPYYVQTGFEYCDIKSVCNIS